MRTLKKVDALFDKLSAASKDKQALLALAQEIVSLNQELQSKAKPNEASSETTSKQVSDKQTESSNSTTSSPETSEKEVN